MIALLTLAIALFVIWVIEHLDIEEVKAPFAFAIVGIVILAIKYVIGG